MVGWLEVQELEQEGSLNKRNSGNMSLSKVKNKLDDGDLTTLAQLKHSGVRTEQKLSRYPYTRTEDEITARQITHGMRSLRIFAQHCAHVV